MFEYEKELLEYATVQLQQIGGLKIEGLAAHKEATISFHVEGVEPKELEKYLSEEHNIFVKAGDLNAQPLMKVLGVKGLARLSFSYYNTKEEIDTFIKALKQFLQKIE